MFITWGISKEVHETTVGKREAHINRSIVACKCSTRHWNYLETPMLALRPRTLLGSERHWYATACPDELRDDPITCILRIRFSLSVENNLADAGQDGQTRLARPNFLARAGTGKY